MNIATQGLLNTVHALETIGQQQTRLTDQERGFLMDASRALLAQAEKSSTQELIEIDGYSFSLEQVRGLASQSLSVLLAYEKASPDNGGGESVDWDDLNPVDERIRELVGEEVVAAVAKIAQSSNGYTPDEEMQGNGDAQ